VDARGESVLAHMWTQILFGDYMAYYLAMAYGADPSEEGAVTSFENSVK
jgi:glucose/mannose-6-phosphate isomerase